MSLNSAEALQCSLQPYEHIRRHANLTMLRGRDTDSKPVRGRSFAILNGMCRNILLRQESQRPKLFRQRLRPALTRSEPHGPCGGAWHVGSVALSTVPTNIDQAPVGLLRWLEISSPDLNIAREARLWLASPRAPVFSRDRSRTHWDRRSSPFRASQSERVAEPRGHRRRVRFAAPTLQHVGTDSSCSGSRR